jgi:hypothetical protein
MADLRQMSALTSLNAMMDKGYFSISTIDTVAQLLEVNARGTEAYRLLAPLHCVDFAKMPTELREAVPALIQECLGIAPVFKFKTAQPEVIEVAPTQDRPRRGFLRLLGGSQ